MRSFKTSSSCHAFSAEEEMSVVFPKYPVFNWRTDNAVYFGFHRFFLQKKILTGRWLFQDATQQHICSAWCHIRVWNDLCLCLMRYDMISYQIKGGSETKRGHLTPSLRIGSVSDGLRKKLSYMYLMEKRRVFMFWTYVSYKIQRQITHNCFNYLFVQLKRRQTDV